MTQKMLQIWDSDFNLPNATTLTNTVPCAGWIVISGLIYSTQNLTVTISQGASDSTGALKFRLTTAYTVTALSPLTIEQKIYGKYVSIAINNASGFPAAVEVFFGARSFSLPSTDDTAMRPVRFAIGTGATQTSTSIIPANARIFGAWVEVVAAYSPGATITVGNSASPALLQIAANNNPQVVGIHNVWQDTSWGGANLPVQVTVGGAPAAGAGFCTVFYSATPLT